MSPAAAATQSLRSKVHWPDMEHTPHSHTAVSKFLQSLQETYGQLHCRKETKHFNQHACRQVAAALRAAHAVTIWPSET